MKSFLICRIPIENDKLKENTILIVETTWRKD